VGDAKAKAGDILMGAIMAVNPGWQCAAVKILSNAGAHRIVALSEKWVGKPKKDGTGRFPKFIGAATEFIFPIATLVGPTLVPSSRSDRVRGSGPSDEIPSGGSVPSCGKCQTFLPALICEMKPCG
jgi:hypothetical protein